MTALSLYFRALSGMLIHIRPVAAGDSTNDDDFHASSFDLTAIIRS
jgi:hypothetical protein